MRAVFSGASLAHAIEESMGKQFQPGDVEAVKSDKQVALGFVFTRYGSYTSPNIRNDHGEMVADDRESASCKPGWIQNIWLHYSALTTPGSRLAVRLPLGFMNEYPKY